MPNGDYVAQILGADGSVVGTSPVTVNEDNQNVTALITASAAAIAAAGGVGTGAGGLSPELLLLGFGLAGAVTIIGVIVAKGPASPSK